MVIKTYRRHRCESQHRTYRTFLKCAIRRLEWVMGDGQFAVIAWCGVPTVTLHKRLEDARDAWETVNATGCGGRCSRRHEIVRLDRGGRHGER